MGGSEAQQSAIVSAVLDALPGCRVPTVAERELLGAPLSEASGVRLLEHKLEEIVSALVCLYCQLRSP